MIDPKLRIMLVTIRAALIMGAKAIAKYLDEGAESMESVKIGETDSVTSL